ncbi:hypothetical protein KY290_034108 [Solanum tuberosum]|uniref:Major sperm protein n=1 Tax=Solanum tuberosum TaxID=4113 RepID=A0ABQ7U5Z1_SOLTU|nr:hypothetical protein KY289_033500 [Solanum tuberosum]KAH0741065.1 hypothetical protein KY290_034108 [Solanum tuberosum]
MSQFNHRQHLHFHQRRTSRLPNQNKFHSFHHHMAMNNANNPQSPPFPPPQPLYQPNYPNDPQQLNLMTKVPNYTPRHLAFQHLTNPPTPFDTNYVTQNTHLSQNDLTPIPIVIGERLTNSLIRLAATQLELIQELTTLERYYILHQPTPLSNPNMQHLLLIHQLNSSVNYSLRQILNMEGANLPNEVTTIYEEDDQMRDQVVPQIHMRELSPSTQYNDPNQMREEEPNILNIPLQTLYLRNSLTIDMHQNTERNILIKVPKEILKTTMNIRFYNTSTPPKYVVLTIPTLKGKQPIEGIFSEKNQTNVNLEMSLVLGGSSTPLEELSMKILL